MSENNNRSVERALSILDCFSKGKGSYSLTEISKMTNLSPSTATRLLSTLEKQNYLFRDEETSKYYLGFKLIRIGNIAFENLDYQKVAKIYLTEMHEKFNESVGIYMLKDNYRVCIDRIEGNNELKSSVGIGDVYPLDKGASGKILLAHQKEEFIEKIVGKENEKIIKELKEIKDRGYFISYGERVSGVISISAPIFNAKKEVKAAIFITIPSIRGEESKLKEMLALLKNSAENISLILGYKK